MALTNAQLQLEIEKLKKELEYLKGNIEPQIGRFEGQLFYDKIQGLKYWDGFKFNLIGSGVGGGTMRIFGRPASNGTGLEQFTGFGFKPKSYIILAVRDEMTTLYEKGNHCFSYGGYDGNTEGIMQIADGYSRYSDGNSLRILYTNQGGGETKAEFSKFLDDGIELNFTVSEENIHLFIIAF